MMSQNRWRFWKLASLLLACVALIVACTGSPTPAPPTQVAVATPVVHNLRLFWVNSYAEDDFWTTRMRSGLVETLARQGYSGIDNTLELGAYHLGFVQVGDEENLAPQVDEAIARIQAFAPDIVIVSGDEAIQTLITRYPDPGQRFVYCGLNGDPDELGLDRSRVTGVLDRRPLVQTVALARDLVGDVGPYLLLSDASPAGVASAKTSVATVDFELDNRLPIVHIVDRWAAWQQVVIDETPGATFIVVVHYRALPDETGEGVTEQEMMAWMLAHASIPVFALSDYAVASGAVGGLVVSGYNQGQAAADLAVHVANNPDAADLPEPVSVSNMLALNFPAAHNWDLRIPVAIPLAAEIYRRLPEGGQ